MGSKKNSLPAGNKSPANNSFNQGPFENSCIPDSDSDDNEKHRSAGIENRDYSGDFKKRLFPEIENRDGAGDNKIRRIAGIFISLIVILIVILAILRPKNPKFIIEDATVFLFNVSAVNFLSATIQVTITARNPNDILGIYYDRIDVSAVYMDQQITLPAAVRPMFQRHGDVNVWSPLLVGDNVPIAPYIGADLGRDLSVLGPVFMSIKLDGRVRFKVWFLTSGGFRLDVDCPAVIVFGDPTAGVVVGNNVVKYRLVRPCSGGVN